MVIAVDKVDQSVRHKRKNRHSDVKLQSLSLTPAQRETLYKSSSVPQDPIYQSCPFCDHPSVNETLENGDIEAINCVVESEYQSKLKV